MPKNLAGNLGARL